MSEETTTVELDAELQTIADQLDGLTLLFLDIRSPIQRAQRKLACVKVSPLLQTKDYTPSGLDSIAGSSTYQPRNPKTPEHILKTGRKHSWIDSAPSDGPFGIDIHQTKLRCV